MKWIKRLFTGPALVRVSQEEIDELFEPAMRLAEKKMEELNALKIELEALRGLIGVSCKDCAHKSYCKYKDIYDESWMLGCRYFEQYKKRTSEDFDRIIGDTRFVLHGYEFVRREAD